MEAEEEPVEAEQRSPARRAPRSRASRSLPRGCPGGRPGATSATDTARPRARAGRRARGELGAERDPEALADVAHVAELTVVEGFRPVRQLRALEQRDALAAREDRVEPDECEPEPLRRRQPVGVGRKPLRSISCRTKRSVASSRKASTMKIGVTVSAIRTTPSDWSPRIERRPAGSGSEAEERLDLVPDRDGERHARDEKKEQDEPEADPRASRRACGARSALSAGPGAGAPCRRTRS